MATSGASSPGAFAEAFADFVAIAGLDMAAPPTTSSPAPTASSLEDDPVTGIEERGSAGSPRWAPRQLQSRMLRLRRGPLLPRLFRPWPPPRSCLLTPCSWTATCGRRRATSPPASRSLPLYIIFEPTRSQVRAAQQHNDPVFTTRRAALQVRVPALPTKAGSKPTGSAHALSGEQKGLARKSC